MARTLSSTTLGAAYTKGDDKLTVASTTGITAGMLAYVGRTAWRINAVVGSTRLDVSTPVDGPAVSYPTGKKVWFGVASDFYASRKVGTGDPATEVVLPRVVLGRDGGVMQTLVGTAENGYRWVDTQDEPHDALPKPRYRYTEPGAIAIETGIHELGGDGADAMTLGTPTVDDNGKELDIVSITAQAFTVTMTTADVGQGAGADVITFGGAIGESVTLRVVNAKWHIVSLRTATAG
jgi:hypothetical protein